MCIKPSYIISGVVGALVGNGGMDAVIAGQYRLAYSFVAVFLAFVAYAVAVAHEPSTSRG